MFVCAFTLDNLFGLKLNTLQSPEFYHTRLLKRLPFDIYFLDTTQAETNHAGERGERRH